MCAKWGVAETHRLMLGYHSSGKDGSLLEYSRDAMAAPVASLNQVIADIVTGRFDTDMHQDRKVDGQAGR